MMTTDTMRMTKTNDVSRLLNIIIFAHQHCHQWRCDTDEMS
jgi:hypothetical protein